MTQAIRRAELRGPSERSPQQFRLPLLLFGVGLGGFVDGIVLHQILQWHHMISDTREGPMNTLAGLEANTLADGLFHLFALVVVLVALYLAMRTKTSGSTAVVPSWDVVTGWLLVGWAACTASARELMTRPHPLDGDTLAG